MRSEKQYREIASVCSNLIEKIPGCVMVFFPSYGVRDSVSQFLETKKPVFFETPKLDKEEKQKLLDKFSSSKQGVLLGVAAGSFGEGIDLPDIVKAVIVVGLPLDKRDLETTELLAYYDKKFGKGWEYGYILPAMTRCIQNAGRCIRSEKDRGALIFVDARYAWPRYKSCFPPVSQSLEPGLRRRIVPWVGLPLRRQASVTFETPSKVNSARSVLPDWMRSASFRSTAPSTAPGKFFSAKFDYEGDVMRGYEVNFH